jgi:hypothetical protein
VLGLKETADFSPHINMGSSAKKKREKKKDFQVGD